MTKWDDDQRCRRAVLATTASVVCLSGCLSSPADSSSPSEASSPTAESPTTDKSTATTVRRTADGVEATFRVLDGHEPTDDIAKATFEASRIVVTGTMDPRNCRRPTLGAVEYDDANHLRLVVVGEPRYPNENVECGNASYDYRCVVSVDGEMPTRLDVVHDYHGDDERTFTVENG